ncbi:hypothetical protein EJ05DRAFT_502646 [Pseudovirgaria hyperparasitica]|uniref:Uncharacterized protein n=1 Tax=Pseudovirgaria hyperparasitica TaxID=470096 RepID=A0A6A6W548_9PEZI|nr:uncharacterized protein EJ05DRAFT_502646 [Pseudovirgaria hyperparasitica]KAF2756181.1 hypothetical protein EJ05DRAFT_502646 [Pseudovirgaria hyperparasitica]
MGDRHESNVLMALLLVRAPHHVLLVLWLLTAVVYMSGAVAGPSTTGQHGAPDAHRGGNSLSAYLTVRSCLSVPDHALDNTSKMRTFLFAQTTCLSILLMWTVTIMAGCHQQQGSLPPGPTEQATKTLKTVNQDPY